MRRDGFTELGEGAGRVRLFVWFRGKAVKSEFGCSAISLIFPRAVHFATAVLAQKQSPRTPAHGRLFSNFGLAAARAARHRHLPGAAL